MFLNGGYPKFNALRFTEDFLSLFCEKNSNGTKKLRLKGNELFQRFYERLISSDTKAICKFLKKHPEINELDISYNSIEDEGMEILCNQILKKPNNLEYLNLGHCDLTEKGMSTFYYTSLENNINLKTLRLTGNKIQPQGGYMICLSIPFIPSLEYLDLGETDQTADSLDALILNISRSPIKIINISRPIPQSNLRQVDDEFLSSNLRHLLQQSEFLVELHIQKCNLDYNDIQIIIFGLKKNQSLKFLDLGYNEIQCDGADAISQWLQTRPQLLGLNIAGNRIKDTGGLSLSYGLPFSKLRFLDISDNKINDDGITSILHSIKKNYVMRRLLIWGNNLGCSSLTILERMMRSQVFEQENIDVKIYCVDGELQAARFLIDHSKNRYYGTTDYGCAVPIKIKKNQSETNERVLLNFKDIERYPPLTLK